MIGHEHVRMNGAAIFLGVDVQPMEIELIVLIGEEAGRPIVAALDDMQRQIGQKPARAAGHIGFSGQARMDLFAGLVQRGK